jgi:hypothetical protein
MPSQVKATSQELSAVLTTIDNVVKKRAQTGYVDAGNGKWIEDLEFATVTNQ